MSPDECFGIQTQIKPKVLDADCQNQPLHLSLKFGATYSSYSFVPVPD